MLTMTTLTTQYAFVHHSAAHGCEMHAICHSGYSYSKLVRRGLQLLTPAVDAQTFVILHSISFYLGLCGQYAPSPSMFKPLSLCRVLSGREQFA